MDATVEHHVSKHGSDHIILVFETSLRGRQKADFLFIYLFIFLLIEFIWGEDLLLRNRTFGNVALGKENAAQRHVRSLVRSLIPECLLRASPCFR